MTKLACRADLWYTEDLNMLGLDSAGTLSRFANLLRRLAMDMIPQDNTPYKRCSNPNCKNPWLPATPEYFARNKSNKDGFQYRCKRCRSIAKPKRDIPEGHKWCNKGQHSLPATSEYFGHHAAYKGRKARLNSTCKQCKAKTDKDYSASHQEERKEYRASRKEEDKLYMAQWHKDNREHEQVYRTNYLEDNREHERNRHKNYCAVYYKTERGLLQMRVSSGNRRARKRNAAGTHTVDELHQQYQRQKGKCHYCKEKLGKERKSWVAEHVIPLSRGGSNSIDNIVIACVPCNLRKGSKLPHEWIEGGRLL